MGFFDNLLGRGIRPVQVRDITNIRSLPGAATAPRPGIGARAIGPGMAAASAGLNIAAGQSPVDAALSAAGSLILGGIGFRLGGKGGQVAGSTIGAGLPQALDWLGQHAVLSDRGALKPSSIQDRPVVNPQFLRPDYSGAGERARRFQEYRLGTDIPGANTDYSSRLGRAVSPGNPAAERAYRQEVSSVAQQAAQNPELQRYEKERAAAAASKDQGRMDAMRDLGMQIWAQKYGKPGDLASRVKPGQSGYDVIQRTLFPQGSPLPPLSKASQAMLDEIAPANAQGVRENITPMPGQLPAFGGASEAMYQAVTDGGRLVTPMLSPRATTAQETAAQSLVDAYKSSLVGDDEFTQRLKAMQQYMQ